MRISEGVNIFQLAANMGTSVEMIDDFYGTKRCVIRRWPLRLRSDLAAEHRQH
jgi:hypothetical protein